MIKKVILGLVMTVLASVGAMAQAVPASAGELHRSGPGVGFWTREYCEGGSPLLWARLTDGHGHHQGWIYAYVRNHRVCVLITDHLAGAHRMQLEVSGARHPKYWGTDSGVYDSYAGAIALPAYKRARVHDTYLKANGRTYRPSSNYVLVPYGANG